MKKSVCYIAVLSSFSAIAQDANESTQQPEEHITIIGDSMLAPSVYELNAKQPRQPLPAHDGGDFLKTITGFSATRKGGASSDPMFRGMGASRLTIVNDGQMLQGGCSSRMDPPTAYITPQSYDTVRIVKGPQSVRYAGSAATIEFERDTLRYSEPILDGYANLTAASFGRLNGTAELIGGNATGYVKANLSAATADNYEDGDGTEINSQYQRWSGDIDLGWTPSLNHSFKLSLGASDGEAAYADRAMDGAKFERTSTALTYDYEGAGTLQSLTANSYFNYIDHVMDNYSLRNFTPSMMMPNKTARNPDRYSRGARIESTWQLHSQHTTELGIEYHDNKHRDRISRNQEMSPYQSLPRKADAESSQFGLFAEHSMSLTADQRLITGVRFDHWKLTDRRESLGNMMNSQPNPTLNQTHYDDLFSGFIRYEQQTDLGTWYAGLGQAERFPDYWEAIGNNKTYQNSPSALYLQPEQNQQLDLGWQYQNDALQLETSVFFGNIDDFILLEQSSGMMPDSVRNIDATTWGGELTSRWNVTTAWKLSASFAFTRGSNDTDNRYLPQQSADELRLASDYTHNDLTYSLLWRVVKQQDKVDIGRGNVIGYDFAETPGYGVLSANMNWQLDKSWKLAIGVDNLLDKTYAEHISSSGATIAGYEQVDRVNEPGRVFWLQSNLYF